MKTKRLYRNLHGWALGLLSLLATACTSEPYDTGDGSLSYLRADFVEAQTTAPKAIATAITDDGNQLVLTQPIEASWATTADSTYRALLYYNEELGSKEMGSKAVAPFSVSRVLVLRPMVPDDNDELKTDPVGMESVWMSSNGKWLNIGLLLKSGRADDEEAIQRIGVLTTALTDDAMTLTFNHDQGGVPEYYTSRVYASIPVTEAMHGKTVTLRLNTYQGFVVRTFSIE